MCGVPYHSAQTYLSRLIKQGFGGHCRTVRRKCGRIENSKKILKEMWYE